MASMKRPRLTRAEPLDGFRLRITFIDGQIYTVDFHPLFEASPGLAPLRDPAVFATATVIEGEGWTVTWPSPDIQIGADTLWLDAQAQQAPEENTRTFRMARAQRAVAQAGRLGARSDTAHNERLRHGPAPGAALYCARVQGLGGRAQVVSLRDRRAETAKPSRCHRSPTTSPSSIRNNQ